MIQLQLYNKYLLFMLTLEEQDRDEMLGLLSDLGSKSPELMKLELRGLNKLKLLELLKLWLLEQL